MYLLSKSPYSFPHRRSPQGCEVFNEAELLYPEASIKLRSPKTNQIRVKTANTVSWKFDKRFKQDIGAMNRDSLSDSSSNGSFERPPMKNEATPKNVKRLVEKTAVRKRGNLEKRKGVHSKDLR
jgi:hypothetical protein